MSNKRSAYLEAGIGIVAPISRFLSTISEKRYCRRNGCFFQMLELKLRESKDASFWNIDFSELADKTKNESQNFIDGL